MKIDFNNLRLNIGTLYNDLCRTGLTAEQVTIMGELRGEIGGLLACYDPDSPEDVKNLSEEIVLTEPTESRRTPL